jgi:hypothetical protein
MVGAIDENLTSKGYITPGLGDAGDLSYGEKLQDKFKRDSRNLSLNSII